MIHDFNTHTFPLKIKENYHLGPLLSLQDNGIVFLLKEKEKNQKKARLQNTPCQENDRTQYPLILKVIPKSYFDKPLFQKITSLHAPHLLYPTELFAEKGYIYAIYPNMRSLSEYLAQGTLPFSLLLQWIKEMDKIISWLHKNKILHGDIAPGNIYLDEEGHFYLGDYSSARLLSFQDKSFPLFFRKKTASTYPIPFCVTDFRQDIFSFLTLLSHLIKSISSSEKETAALSHLQEEIDKLLFQIIHQKSYDCSFSQICQKILLVIHKEQLEKQFIQTDFMIAPSEMDFLKESTKPVKKELLQPYWIKDKPVPFLGLVLCFTVFIFSISYCFSAKNQTSIKYQDISSISFKKTAIQSPAATSVLKTPAPTTTPTHFPTFTPDINSLSSATPDSAHTILTLSHRKYNTLPKCIKEKTSHVKIIFAENNQLKSLSPFLQFSLLEELYLDQNRITDLGNLSSLKHLKILGLSNNQITDVSALGTINSLTILDLSNQTCLSNFSSLEKLTKLKYLILTDTNISQKEIKHLQQKLPGCTILY